MRRRAWAVCLALCGVVGCGGGGSDSESARAFRVQGSAQKGPLLSGSNVTVQELDASLRPTGRTCSTVTDDLGNFSVEIESASGLVEIIADGYYFDELSGRVSSAPLTLRGVANLSAGSDVHVNVLTHLSRDRIFALVEAGEPFAQAKARAEAEVGEVFHAIGPLVSDFERLDISKPGEANASLLAASATIMGAAAAADGGNVTGEVTSLLSALSGDLTDDGRVDGPGLTAPLEQAFLDLDLGAVAAHMESRYEGSHFSDLAEVVNRAPVAAAGEDGAGCVGETVNLTSAGSHDVDDDPLTSGWEITRAPEGSTAALSGADQAAASFVPDRAGEYTLTLAVSDGHLGDHSQVRWTAGLCSGPPAALQVGDPAPAAGGEWLFDALETTDDSGNDGDPGTADFGQGDRLPTPGEAVLKALAADEMLVSVGCDACQNTVVERAILTYRDGRGNERSFAPSVGVGLEEPISTGAPANLRLVGLPLEMKTRSGGLRDIFLGVPSADRLYGSQSEERDAASSWTLGLDLYGRDTVSGQLFRGSASAAFRVQNPMGSPSDWVVDYGVLTIDADTVNRTARLSWAPVDGAASYLLRWEASGHQWGPQVASSGAVPVAGTEWTLPHPRFAEYSFRLAAVRSDGAVAPPSFEQRMTSFDSLSHYPVGPMCTDCHLVSHTWGQPDGIVSLLRPPANVAASVGTPSGSITLSWSPAWTATRWPDSSEVPWPWPIEYRVYGATTSPVTTESRQLGSTSGTMFNHRAEPGQTYYYRVFAVSENGQWSRMSQEVSVSAPP